MDTLLGEEGAEMESEITQIEIDRTDEEKQDSKAIMSNKVDEPDFSKATSKDPTTSVAITKTWRVFVGSSTLHGLQYVFTSRTLIGRILWALFLVAAIVWFSFQSSKLLKKYFSYPAATKVSLVYEGSPEFPAVSICNFNQFKKSVIMEKGYDQPLSQFDRKVFGPNTDNFTTDFGKYRHLNLTEFSLSSGHQINDTLTACRFSGMSCDYRNFTPVLTSMGLCHTFNSGKGGESILKVKQAGSTFGLLITLNVHRQEYYGVASFQTGFKILIHHQGTPPIVSQLGFAVGPGTTTFAAIRKQRVLNLPSPYESNCFNETVNIIPGYPKYTIPSCMLICETKFVIEKCGCRGVGMPDLNNTKVCDLEETANCLVQLKNNSNVLKNYQCDCPVPCDSITFKPALSYADFPSSNFVSTILKSHYPPDAPNVTEIIKEREEYIRQNKVYLRIYFQELNSQLIQEIPAYDLESMLGEIGGQVGLCVGASLLTVLEFIDVIFSVIKIRLGFR